MRDPAFLNALAAAANMAVEKAAEAVERLTARYTRRSFKSPVYDRAWLGGRSRTSGIPWDGRRAAWNRRSAGSWRKLARKYP